MLTNDCIDIEGHTQHTLPVTAAAAQTAALPQGIYDVWCDVDVWIQVGKDADDVTLTNGYKIAADNTVAVKIDDGRKLGAIAGGSGTLSYHKVG